jgi:hypothetical protein
MTGFEDHYHKAKMEFVNWYYDYHPDKELSGFWNSNCGHIDDMMMYDDELKFALAAFEDYQVKIMYQYFPAREHCLKIKWEVNPWWPNQILHFYYCIMLPIDNVEFKTPYELVTEEE